MFILIYPLFMFCYSSVVVGNTQGRMAEIDLRKGNRYVFLVLQGFVKQEWIVMSLIKCFVN